MPRISLADVRSLGDMLDTASFEMLFGTLPIAGASKGLTLKCQQVVIPGFQNQLIDILLHGFTRKQRGNKVFPHILQCMFYEDANASTLKQLRQWHEAVVGTQSGSSLGPNIGGYSVDAQLKIYNQQAVLVDTINVFSVFPDNIGDTQLDGANSQAMMINASFAYDYFESSNTASR